MRWSQEAIVLAFRKLFPAEWFEGFAFPMVEDLVNQSPLIDFPAWLSKQDIDWDSTANSVKTWVEAPSLGTKLRASMDNGRILSHKLGQKAAGKQLTGVPPLTALVSLTRRIVTPYARPRSLPNCSGREGIMEYDSTPLKPTTRQRGD